MKECDEIQQIEQEIRHLYNKLDKYEDKLDKLRNPSDLSNLLPTHTYLSGIRLWFNPITQQVILKDNDFSTLYQWAAWYDPTLGEIEDKVRELEV